MPNFKYKVRDNHGRPAAGIIESDSKEAVAGHLKKMGYTPTLIEEAMPRLGNAGSFFEKFFRGKVRLEELIIFTRQLMTLQKAGVPILSSLDSIREQVINKYFKKIIEDIIRNVESGKSLSDSFAQYPDVFSEIYVNMVRSGEAAGVLDDILNRLGNLLEHELEIRMKIKQATRYPLLVLATIAMAFPITIVFIIPKFADLFNAFDTPLPAPTRILIWLNFILTHYWALVILVPVPAVILFRKIVAKENIRPYWDRFKLKIPVFGDLFLKIAMARFTKMCSIMAASGIPILNALEIVKGGVGNKIISDSVDNIIAGITEGESMALSMKASGLYPGIVTQMVKVGEDTGKLDQLLMNVGEYYDTQIDYIVKNLAVLVEPILIVVLGIMVLFLALGIFLPMWNLASLYMKIGGL